MIEDSRGVLSHVLWATLRSVALFPAHLNRNPALLLSVHLFVIWELMPHLYYPLKWQAEEEEGGWWEKGGASGSQSEGDSSNETSTIPLVETNTHTQTHAHTLLD